MITIIFFCYINCMKIMNFIAANRSVKDIFSLMSGNVPTFGRSFSTASGNNFLKAIETSGVGILAMEMYIPQRFVDQSKLEIFDGASAGKYTKGLGQSKMAFVDDREDINSIALTAVQRLLDAYDIDPRDVGRIEFGTETIIDKSKSSKTVLNRLFPQTNIEGVTSINACYGGTAALFNSAAWLESSENADPLNGRKYAIYVAGDIAVYADKSARMTGGAGCFAVLLGHDAPLQMVPRVRSSHSVDVYDFYKPVSNNNEYPSVDGHYSQRCYLTAVDDCYNGFLDRAAGTLGLSSDDASAASLTNTFDFMAFHSPYNKLVQQSFRRMLYNDARRTAARGQPLPEHLAPLAPFATLPPSETLANKDLEKALSSIGLDLYEKIVGPSTFLSKNIGNTYTGAVHANLLNLVHEQGTGLIGKSIGAFSYGSGAIATLFALRGVDNSSGSNGAFSLRRIQEAVDVRSRLSARTEASPDEYTHALSLREQFYGKTDVVPKGTVDNVPVGAYYLKEITKDAHRIYERKLN